MNYEEWNNLKEVNDHKLIKGFEYPSGEHFYIEPPFYTQLLGIKERYPDDYKKVVNYMENLCKTKKKIIFTYDYENPFIEIDGYVYLEITDVTDPIQVFYENKSRGSDYGD